MYDLKKTRNILEQPYSFTLSELKSEAASLWICMVGRGWRSQNWRFINAETMMLLSVFLVALPKLCTKFLPIREFRPLQIAIATPDMFLTPKHFLPLNYLARLLMLWEDMDIAHSWIVQKECAALFKASTEYPAFVAIASQKWQGTKDENLMCSST